MSLNSVLKKLTEEDKLILLRHIVILPTIEEDSFLSEDERSDIFLAGQKLGFSKELIEEEINIQLNEEGAVQEKSKE